MDKGRKKPPSDAESQQPSLRLWMVAASGAIISLFTYGAMKCNSLIFVEIMKVEQVGRGVASMPFAFNGAAGILVAPITGILGFHFSFVKLVCFGLLLDFIGYVVCYFSTNMFTLILFFGLFKATGHHIIRTLIPPVINNSFKKHKTTAMGVATMGLSLAGFVWPYLAQHFLNTYDLKGTFLLIAAISMHSLIGVIYIAFYKNENDIQVERRGFRRRNLLQASTNKMISFAQNGTKHSAIEKSSDSPNNGVSNVDFQSLQHQDTNYLGDSSNLSESSTEEGAPIRRKSYVFFKNILCKVMTTPELYLLSFGRAFTGWSFQSFNQLTVDYLGDKGIPETSALMVISMFSAGGVLGRLCFGWITDKGFLRKELMIASTMMIIATFTTLTTLTNNYSLLMVYGIILGMCQGSSMVVNWVQYGQYFTEEEMLLAMSLGKIIPGIMILTRAAVVGFFRDYLESYNYYFLFTAMMVFLLSLTWFVKVLIEDRKNKRYQLVPTENLDKK